MTTVKIYKYRRPYQGPVSDRMGTRKYIESSNCTVIEATELEVDSLDVDADGKTVIGFQLKR
jgi:hypothetical protein